MQQDIGTGVIRLTDYLPPTEILGEYALGAIVAFVVVQCIKSAHRDRGGRLSRAQMSGYAAGVATCAIAAQLLLVHEYPAGKALAYAVQGGLLAPVVITVLLWTLDRYAPSLRQQFSQQRRTRSEGPPNGVERRDETGRYL